MKYTRNFLSQVVLRIDYPRVPDIGSERRPELMARIIGAFPQVAGVQQAQVQFTVGAEQPAIEKKLVGYNWIANDAAGNKRVELTTDSLSLVNANKSFTNFDDFFKEFSTIFQAFEEIYGVAEFTRVGLRYINEIELNEGSALDWDGYLSKDVIGAAKFRIPKDFSLSRSMHQIVSIHDDVTLVSNFGIYNPDFPAAIARRQFILDFDCYITGAVGRDEMLRRVKELNKVCEDSFEGSVEARLREVMGKLDD